MRAQKTREPRRRDIERSANGPHGGRPGHDNGTVHKALDDIQYIRDIIDMSQDFFVSGWSGVAAGVIMVVGAALSALIISRPERWEVAPALWALWIVIGLLSSLTDIIFFVRVCRRAGREVFSVLLAKISLTEAIIAAQGLILTFIFLRIGTPIYIPGAWLLAYGTTLTALGLFFPGGLWILGLTVFLTSIAAFVIPAGGLWCVGFGGAATCLWGAGYLVTRGK